MFRHQQPKMHGVEEADLRLDGAVEAGKPPAACTLYADPSCGQSQSISRLSRVQSPHLDFRRCSVEK